MDSGRALCPDSTARRERLGPSFPVNPRFCHRWKSRTDGGRACDAGFLRGFCGCDLGSRSRSMTIMFRKSTTAEVQSGKYKPSEIRCNRERALGYKMKKPRMPRRPKSAANMPGCSFGREFLTAHLFHGRSEIDVEYISVGRNQSGDGFHAGRFGFVDPGAVFAHVDDLHVVGSDEVYDVVFRADAYRAARVVEFGF